MTDVRARAQSPADCGPLFPSECNATYQFTCKNKLCKPVFWLCDSVNDCGDNSDELECSECGVGLPGPPRGPPSAGGIVEQLLNVVGASCPQAVQLRPSGVVMGSASPRTSSVTGLTTVAMAPMRPCVTSVRPGGSRKEGSSCEHTHISGCPKFNKHTPS